MGKAKKKVNLYSVGMEHKETGEKIHLEVWAEDVDKATDECCFLFGYDAQYRWTGSGPVCDENGEIQSKQI